MKSANFLHPPPLETISIWRENGARVRRRGKNQAWADEGVMER